MMRKTLSKVMLIMALCLLSIPSLGTTTVYANKTDNGAIPEVKVSTNGDHMELDTGILSEGNKTDFWTKILTEGRGFVVGVSGIGALVAIGVFIMSFMKLGTSAGNPQARTQALTGILWSGIAAAGLGSVTLITGLFYGALK